MKLYTYTSGAWPRTRARAAHCEWRCGWPHAAIQSVRSREVDLGRRADPTEEMLPFETAPVWAPPAASASISSRTTSARAAAAAASVALVEARAHRRPRAWAVSRRPAVRSACLDGTLAAWTLPMPAGACILLGAAVPRPPPAEAAMSARSRSAMRVPSAPTSPGHCDCVRFARLLSATVANGSNRTGPGSSLCTNSSVTAHDAQCARSNAAPAAVGQRRSRRRWLELELLHRGREPFCAHACCRPRPWCWSKTTAACVCSELCGPTSKARPTAAAMSTQGFKNGSEPSTKARSDSSLS